MLTLWGSSGGTPFLSRTLAWLGSVRRQLETFLDLHVQRGTYLVLEAVKAVVYRTLLKRTYRLAGEAKDAPANNTQLKLS